MQGAQFERWHAGVLGWPGWLIFAVAACGGSPEPTPDAGGATPSTCARDSQSDVFVPGLSRASGGMTVKLLESKPAPPAKAMNEWTILLSGGSAPIDGATLTVVPFMPEHGHGSSVRPAVSGKGNGVYVVSNLYFPMPGLWRVTIHIETQTDAPQDIAFAFCIDG